MKNIFLMLVFFTVACNSKNANITNATTTSFVADTNLSEAQKTIILNLQKQIASTKNYDANYVAIKYPNGDVPIKTGVCADVVIRAMRSVDIDLQKEVHEDMKANFNKYPNKWNLKTTDKNIDHRRVPNLMNFFERKNKSIAITKNNIDYKPTDIVAWKLDNGLLHIGMISNEFATDGTPLIIHNIGSGTTSANVLFEWKIIGHYRWF